MGEIILKYYKYASELGGLRAKLEIAKITLIPVTRAAFIEDTPENIRIFRQAVKDVLGKEAPKF